MDERSRNEVSPQLLDLIPNEREWQMNRNEGKSSEERKLELRLGPPGEDWSLGGKMKNANSEREESLLSLGCFPSSNMSHAILSPNNGFQSKASPWPNYHNQVNNKTSSPFLQFPSAPPVMGKDSSQNCCPKVVELQNGCGGGDSKVFSPSSANTAVSQPNTSQKRTAPAPVVGWPPIRSFRKNLASSSTSKPPTESQHEQHNKVAGKKPVDNYGGKGLFVKINMDGVPIGRKVDLNAYDSYENLSSAVDELFRGLLAAQRDSSAGGVHNKQDEEKAITGLLDGSGEYTLVYEDNEGDRMLVGDVPWHMFVSTVKRLRVLKSSELSAFTLGSKQEKISLDSAMK
ncbi:auxin-responsive protein IAA26-like isoform X2 [Vigna unguiculata]|uniref:Auxin-induced protein n=1 Tax=Vigna unguiculata TaxID=3917 RepID=A0A4D6N6W3_VIGUN|nr:auxin-responsive protein IAA26-like isoform X1 [Vigna unguiculata]XP_027928228.1 auxin-responsive protein IAA26-like isoform X2 [Vigna unguiculata]QCE09008.1 auxin-responsive protein IAA [Vigna unguiculata]